MPGESDVVSAGTQEISLRNQLGDAGYVEWKRRTDAIEESKVDDHRAHARHTTATAGYLEAKAAFWRLTGFVLFAGTCCGVAEFIRWVA